MVYYDAQVVTNQMAYGIIGHAVIAWLKKTKIVPFINDQTWWVNRILAIVGATLSALSINYSYSYTPADGVFILTLTGLTLAGMWHGMMQWVVAYGFQQLPYHLTRTSEDKPTGA